MGFYSIISNANVTYCLRTVSQHIWRILHTLHIQYNIQLAKGFYMKFSDVPIKMPTDLLTSYRIWAFVHDSSRGILLERCTPFCLKQNVFSLFCSALFSSILFRISKTLGSAVLGYFEYNQNVGYSWQGQEQYDRHVLSLNNQHPSSLFSRTLGILGRMQQNICSVLHIYSYLVT